MSCIGWKMSLVLSVIAIVGSSDAFYDDFEDGYLGGWTARCAYGTWTELGGYVYGSTGDTPAVLINPSGISSQDCEVSVLCTGEHAFGIIARLNSEDTGVIAYVSPDADVARIRLVGSGQLLDPLATFNADFPEGEQYLLTFSCQGPLLNFDISIPSTGDNWSFSANTSIVQSGESGLLMGNEDCAQWDWFSLSTGIGGGEEVVLPDQEFDVRPNPFSDMVTVSVDGLDGSSGPLEIFDLSGRSITSIPAGRGSDGTASFRWNGMAADGTRSPAGVYLMRLSGSGDPVVFHPLVRID